MIGEGNLYSKEAERGVLGAMFLPDKGRDKVIAAVEAGLTADSFYFPSHQTIWDAIADAHNHGLAIREDIIISRVPTDVMDELGGRKALEDVTEGVWDDIFFESHLHIVIEKWEKRRIRTFCQNFLLQIEQGSDTEATIEAIERDALTLKVADRQMDKDVPFARDIAESTMKRIIDLNEGRISMGLKTGFPTLDSMIYGLRPGEVTVMAARPSLGKTTLGLNIAEEVSLAQSETTVFYSYEMTKESLMERMVCSVAGVPQGYYRDRVASREQIEDMQEAAGRISTSNLVISDLSAITARGIHRHSRRIRHHHGLGLIIVDYLQLIPYPGNPNAPREVQVSETSRALKLLAKELGVPVLLLCQLNRACEAEGRYPRLSDLRESGSIEQDADIVLLLSRCVEEGLEGLSRIEVAKNRHGETGVVHLVPKLRVYRFDEYNPKDNEETKYDYSSSKWETGRGDYTDQDIGNGNGEGDSLFIEEDQGRMANQLP